MRMRKAMAAVVATGAITAVILATGAGVAAASSGTSSGGAGTSSVAPAVSAHHTHCKGYNLFYDWTGTGTDYNGTTWSICSNHTFTSGDGGSGPWSNSHKTYTLTYTAGGDAIYVGTKNKHGFCSVTKPCNMTDPSEDATGVWYATKISG